MGTRETATLLLLQRVVADRLAEQNRITRAQARDDFTVVGQRDVGLIGDEPIGTVQLNKGRETWAVTDERALLAYVKAKMPEQVETIERVRPAAVEALRKVAAGKGAAVDDDGEPIPGLSCSVSDPSLMVKPSEDAPDVIALAFFEQRLRFEDLAAPVAIEAAP